ncbi:MAG: DUF6623 family protein [Candidatus Bipolaricaulota bacterium]
MSSRIGHMAVSLALVGLLLVPAKLALAIPSDVDLTGMLSMWMHGTGVQIEFPERVTRTQRMAFHTRIVGEPNTTNWLHFPINTPVVGTYAIFSDDGGLLGDIKNIVAPGADLVLPDSVSWNLYFRRYRLDKVFLCFRTASADVRVTRLHIHDGRRRLAALDNLALHGQQDMREFLITGTPPVHKGICISLCVEFGSSEQRWIELESVGVAGHVK